MALECRSIKQQAHQAKEAQKVNGGGDERCTQLQEQVATAREQVSRMTSQNEALLEQVLEVLVVQGLRQSKALPVGH